MQIDEREDDEVKSRAAHVALWLQANRQWGKAQNLAHAKFQMSAPENREVTLFWFAVVKRLED